MKLAEVCPEGMVMDGGTVATELLLARLTVTPFDGAGALNVTVPVAGTPPVTVAGTMFRLMIVPGCPPPPPPDVDVTASVAETVLPEVALMVTCVEELTVDVFTVNVMDVCPEGTVIEEGTDAAAPLLDRLTCKPFIGAGALSVTVPVAEPPPVTDPGEMDKLARLPPDPPPGLPPPLPTGLTVSTAVTVFAEVALIVADVMKLTVAVDTSKVAEVWPAGIRIELGTVAAALLLDKFTWMPPDAAGAVSVMVAVESCVPPVTLFGESDKLAIVACPCGKSVAAADTLFEFRLAVMSITVVCMTGEVRTRNSVLSWPPGTKTAATTWAAPLSEDNATIVPPRGVGAVRVSVPVNVSPPV